MKYSAVLAAIFFIITAVPLRVSGGGTQDVFLSLTRNTEEIKKMPTSVSVISSKQIAESRSATVGELLGREYGIVASEKGTLGSESTVFLRGASAEEALVLIDGRKINDNSTGTADLSGIPLGSVERVEIIRGSASSVYGTSAFGGVINIITKKDLSGAPLAELGVSGGSYNRQSHKLTVSVNKEKSYGMIDADVLHSDGWRENSAFDSLNVFARAGFKTELCGNFDLSGSSYRSSLGSAGIITGLTPSGYKNGNEKKASTPDAKQDETRTYAKLEHKISIRKGELKTGIYVSNGFLHYKDPLWMQDDENNSSSYGGDIQFDAACGTTIGAEVAQESLLRKDKLTDVKVIDKSRSNGAGFLQKKISVDKLSLIPSVRFDSNSVFGNVFVPRISVIYNVNDSLKLSANSGKAWRAPTFNELYYKDNYGSSGNPELEPEEGISSDLGLSYDGSLFAASFTGFLTDSKNLIQWEYDPVDYSSVTKNVGKSRQSGGEMVFRHRIKEGLTHNINYTYLWAEDTENNQWLTYRPCNRINYGVTYLPFANARINAQAQYVSPQSTGSTPDALSEYATLDLAFAYQLKSSDIWLKVDNITDKFYQTRLGYPIPGRTLSGGVNYRFRG